MFVPVDENCTSRLNLAEALPPKPPIELTFASAETLNAFISEDVSTTSL
jgi:hypothetical protein